MKVTFLDGNKEIEFMLAISHIIAIPNGRIMKGNNESDFFLMKTCKLD